MSGKHSICILFEALASEEQTVFFKQCLLALLHPTCHHQVHSRDPVVVEPRLSKDVEKGLSGVR
jgi:hypothetical protein